MRRYLAAAVLALVAVSSFAQAATEAFDLSAICAGRRQPVGAAQASAVKLFEAPEGSLAILDRGFCAAYLESLMEANIEAALRKPNPSLDGLRLMAPDSVAVPTPVAPPKRWKVRFYMSHSFTTYFNSEVTFHSSRYDVVVKDYEWAERSSREFFEPQTWAKPGNNPAQIFDEPSNTYVVSIERDGHEFFLSAFHPKFFQAPNQVKQVNGTVDGVAVDGAVPLNRPFDGYYTVPGEMKLARNENTYREMAFEIGYGHRFKVFDSRFGSISYVPGVAAGVMVGSNLSVVVQEGKWWDFDDHGDSYGVQGFGGSLTSRIEINGPKERFGLYYENKLSYYKMEHGFMDGTQKYNLGLMGNSVGMKFLISGGKKKVQRAWATLTP